MQIKIKYLKAILLFLMLQISAGMAISAASAEVTYPSRPIRLVVPFSPGGATDILARIIGQKMSANWSQQVVIDNRAGAAGNIGTDMVAKATPDGYTLLMGFDGTLVINPHVYKKLQFNTVRDFSPVTKVADVPVIIVAHPSVPANSIKELIALGKAKPGSINFASAGHGSTGHLAGELLGALVDIRMTHVPYKGGGQALTDAIGGQVQLLFVAVPTVVSYVKSGKLKALGMTSARRSPAMPDVPTVAESGITNFDVSSWYGVLAPAGTPDSIIKKIHLEIVKIAALPDVRDRLLTLGAVPVVNTPEQFSADIKGELARWAKVVKQAGIQE